MLGVKSYPREYVAACRTRVGRQLKAWKAAAAAAKTAAATAEAHFLENLVVVLDASFVHRLRGVEGKDGNPLNEVRMLAASILANDGVMAEDRTIKYQAGKSVSGIAVGDRIRLDPAMVERLAAAFFKEIEARFP